MPVRLYVCPTVQRGSIKAQVIFCFTSTLRSLITMSKKQQKAIVWSTEECGRVSRFSTSGEVLGCQFTLS